MENKTLKQRGFGSSLKNFCKKKPLGAAGIAFLLLLLIVSIFADTLAPVKMEAGTLPTSILHKLEKPYVAMNAEERAEAREKDEVYILGTDNLGRDVLSYLIYGARTSVVLCLGVTVLSTLLSVIIGTLSAVIGGWFDLIIQRLVDAWQCIPGMLITVLLISMFGNGIWQMIIVMSVPGGIGGSRMIRSAAMAVKDSEYVKISEMFGSGVLWKTIRHVLPNTLPLIITTAAGGLGGVVGYGITVFLPRAYYEMNVPLKLPSRHKGRHER